MAAGAQCVDEAGKATAEILAQVRRVSDLIAEISAATTEQSGGVQQIDEAIVELDHITKQNASLVEEGASASERLEQQAERLVDAVSVFR